MYQLEQETISSWKKQKGGYNDNFFPAAVNSNCPHCTALVTYSFAHWHKALHGVSVGKTDCPSCSETVRFILMDYDPATQTFDEDTSLWIHPPLKTHQGLEEIDNTDQLDKKLINAYHSTMNVFNSGEWNATAILIRRFLDGMIKDNLGKNHTDQALEKQLIALVQSNDLAQPLEKMAETVSHGMAKQFFDLELETNEECAELMIDFVNLLVEYLYVIPMRAESIYQRSCAFQENASNSATAQASATEESRTVEAVS